MLPTAPDQGVTLAHQETVAGFQRRVRRNVRRAVDVAQGQGLAAVQHVQQQPSVALSGVVRVEDAEVGVELHQPVGIARGQLDVGNGLVGRMKRVNGKVRRPVNLRILARFTKRLPAGKGTLRSDFKPGDRHSSLLNLTRFPCVFASLRHCVIAFDLTPELAEELADFAGQQAGLLEGGEVAAAGHFLPAAHVVGALGPLAGRAGRFPAGT